ncbi:MAG: hypothetical protein E4H13_11365, partial [Calditrichales bacterium]
MEKATNILELPIKKEIPEIFKDWDKINYKETIKLRYKPIGTRSKRKDIKKVTGYSLYLDIWQDGRHKYEFL